MRNSWASAWVNPPVRLRAVPARWAAVLRVLWYVVFLFAVGVVVLGTAQAVRDAYQVQPAFTAVGLDYDVENDGTISIKIESGPNRRLTERHRLRIVAIDGSPVDANIRTYELARQLTGAEPQVVLDLKASDGTVVQVQQVRDRDVRTPVTTRARDLRVAARLASGLLACGALIFCSFLLARRRPNDPVALLFAFAFAGMASTIDPPLAMWMAMGWPVAYDIISSAWFYLLLIALATFPDGIFVPRFYRWILLAGIPLAVFVSLPNVDANIQVFAGVGSLLAMMVGQVRRYRRLTPGIERQQIKWAAFGFTTGLLLILIAFVLLALFADTESALINMLIVIAFSLGMAAIPLGLLIALIQFRLWEADTVITRSAAYAFVTLIIGVVWAASADLMKLVIEQIIGRESQAGATTLGAIVAAGLFSPTQSLVLGWTRRRFGGPVDQVRGAADRLKRWGLTETPAEVATRALAIVDDAVHPSASAILLDVPLGRELVAARNASAENDEALVERIPLADDESPVGTLLLGRRSDGNRYNREQLQALDDLIPALAEALRVARSRHWREASMQQRLDEMASRLAQLEDRKPKPA